LPWRTKVIKERPKILDRIGPGTERTRSWAKNNYAAMLERMGDFAGAASFVEDAVTLKERALGKEHPDVALSLANLAYMQNELGRPDVALATANRAVGIFLSYGDPDSEQFANASNSLGEALLLLGRFADAERPFAESARRARRARSRQSRRNAFRPRARSLGEWRRQTSRHRPCDERRQRIFG
jgi:tetratricopeptide (TPR) repeat protein